jgi:hypothetical protein
MRSCQILGLLNWHIFNSDRWPCETCHISDMHTLIVSHCMSVNLGSGQEMLSEGVLSITVLFVIRRFPSSSTLFDPQKSTLADWWAGSKNDLQRSKKQTSQQKNLHLHLVLSDSRTKLSFFFFFKLNWYCTFCMCKRRLMFLQKILIGWNVFTLKIAAGAMTDRCYWHRGIGETLMASLAAFMSFLFRYSICHPPSHLHGLSLSLSMLCISTPWPTHPL